MRIRIFQIWIGSMFVSSQNKMFIRESIGNKNSFKEMNTYKGNGNPVLHFTVGRLFNNQ